MGQRGHGLCNRPKRLKVSNLHVSQAKEQSAVCVGFLVGSNEGSQTK